MADGERRQPLPLKPGDVEVLARYYGADQDTLERLARLARGPRERTWPAAYRHGC